MNDRVINLQQAGLKRYERALRKERDIKRELLDLLKMGLRRDAVALLQSHLREVGELERG